MKRWTIASVAVLTDKIGKCNRFTLALLCLLLGWGVSLHFAVVSAAADPVALKIQGADTIGNSVQMWNVPPDAVGTVTTILSSSSANAAASNNLTIGGVAGTRTYCTGFEVTGGGATAGSVVTITLNNCAQGTFNYQYGVATGAAVGNTPLIVQFVPPLSANATGTAITLTVPSFGAGNTAAAATIHGFRQ